MTFAAIFDMDGVIMDTTEYIIESFSTYMKSIKIDAQIDGKSIMGIPAKRIIEALEKDHEIKIDHKDFLAKTREMQYEFIKARGQPTSGLVEFLIDLKSKGIPMIVATSSGRDRAKAILEFAGVSGFFPVIVAKEDVEKHKPFPDVFLKAAQKLNVKPKDCIVFEDAPAGIEAAKRAGMKCIGILTKYVGKKDLSNASEIINDFTEINYDKVLEIVKN